MASAGSRSLLTVASQHPETGQTETHQARPEPPTPENRHLITSNITASILLSALHSNPSNSTSDYSYVASLSPSLLPPHFHTHTYTYPDNLPSSSILIDRIGWLDLGELARYLMLGYRVWDTHGRRLHLAGSPLGYDALKAPFRYKMKEVSTQNESEVPDYWVQMQCEERVMPWDVPLEIPGWREEARSELERVKRMWVQSRYDNAQSCYSREDCSEFERFGGWKVDEPILMPFNENTELVTGPYRQIGIDKHCLTTMYPPTHVTLKHIDNGHPSPDNLCEICAKLNFLGLFEWGLQDIEVSFRTTDELLARNDCPFCRLLGVLCEDGMDSLRRRNYQNGEDGFDLNLPIEALFVRNPKLCLSTKPFLVLKQGWKREYLGPIVSLRTVRGDIRGKFEMEVSRFVDFSVLKKMLESCASNHATCARNDHNSKKNDEMILIDVQQMCLVTSPTTEPYLTLSYVWGSPTPFKTLTTNITALQSPGALHTIPSFKLLQDAATVARSLNIPYLWIDALCIIQDSPIHITSQISVMSSIYANAYATIVALTSGSSSSPLPGVSEPRPKVVEVVTGMPFSVHLAGLEKAKRGTPYESRGWTMQERMLSRRCLVFGERSVWLECAESCESDVEHMFPECDRGRGVRAANPLRKMLDNSSSIGMAELDAWCEIVLQYTSRKLSFESDIEKAFLGIETSLSQNRNWSYVAGLPTAVFDWALLWLPRGQLKRRSWTDGNGDVVRPPSWSWMGWMGDSGYACYDYLHKSFFLNLRPRVDKYVVCVAGRKNEMKRLPSAIWHAEIQSSIRHEEAPCLNIPTTPTPILEFEADTISAFPSFSNLPIEWATTGSDYGMLRHGLRYEYNTYVETVAKSYMQEGRTVYVCALATVDVQQSFRGGQFAESKLFEQKGRIVVMLVVLGGTGEVDAEGEGDEKGKDGVEEGNVAERIAIGFLPEEVWDVLEVEKKLIWLV